MIVPDQTIGAFLKRLHAAGCSAGELGRTKAAHDLATELLPIVEWQLLRKAKAPVARRFPSAIPAAERQSLFTKLTAKGVAEPIEA